MLALVPKPFIGTFYPFHKIFCVAQYNFNDPAFEIRLDTQQLLREI